MPPPADKSTGKVGRPPALKPEHLDALAELTREMPQASMDELTRAFAQRTGLHVCSATVRKGLKHRGITRARAPRKPSPKAPSQGSAKQRYGYTEAHRRESNGQAMSTDFTDAEWALVGHLFERVGKRGAPPTHARRDIANGCLYVLRTGCPWRLLPKHYPPWRAVYSAFRKWAHDGTFERIHDALRQQWRSRIGRNPEPSAAIIDSQSNRASPQGGICGFDAGKKVKGRKRHLVVDSFGLLLAVTVTAASVQDRDAAAEVVAQASRKAPTVTKLFADSAYAGRCARDIEQANALSVEIVRHPANRVTGTFVTGEQQPLWPGYRP